MGKKMQFKRADKHLERCMETCKYNSIGICGFSLRSKLGCFLDPDVQKEAALLFLVAREQNALEIAKSMARGKL